MRQGASQTKPRCSMVDAFMADAEARLGADADAAPLLDSLVAEWKKREKGSRATLTLPLPSLLLFADAGIPAAVAAADDIALLRRAVEGLAIAAVGRGRAGGEGKGTSNTCTVVAVAAVALPFRPALLRFDLLITSGNRSCVCSRLAAEDIDDAEESDIDAVAPGTTEMDGDREGEREEREGSLPLPGTLSCSAPPGRANGKVKCAPAIAVAVAAASMLSDGLRECGCE